jgi:tetratricopeptide (TPR) repeat protein
MIRIDCSFYNLPAQMRNLLLSFCLLTILSCSNGTTENSQSDLQARFDSAWNSSSPEQIQRIRSGIASLSERNEFTLYCRAWVLSQKSEPAKALKTADSLVMGFPTFVRGWYLRANLRAENKDVEGALTDFDKAVKKDPQFFEAWMNRGAVHFSNQHPDLALKDFQSAQKLKPAHPDVFLNLANCWLALGQADSACVFLGKAEQAGNPKATELKQRFCETSVK